nr:MULTISPECIES: alpha/beta hydrolase-fold protein [Pseudoalteromonas]
MTYLKAKYRLTENRILTGFSAGGSFTLYMLHTKPMLFNGYFAFSPAPWYDDMTVLNHFNAFLQVQTQSYYRPTLLYFTFGGAEHKVMLKTYNNLEQSLVSHTNNWLVRRSKVNPDAKHNDNPALSIKGALTGYDEFIN